MKESFLPNMHQNAIAHILAKQTLSFTPTSDKSVRCEMNPETQILEANTAFATNLYQILARRKGNIFFSPSSIHTVLSMLYQGAENETAQILASTLKIPDVGVTAEGYRTAIKGLNAIKHVTLLSANKIYGEKKFRKEFDECLSKNFESQVESLDLGDAKKAADRINKWVEEKTQKNIKNIVNEQLLKQNMSLILINAIYFKGEWVSKFKKEATKIEKFHLDEKSVIDVEMMQQKGSYWYKEDDELGAQVLEMPYKGYDVKMIVILPRDDKIENLEGKLAKSDLQNITKGLKLTDVQLSLPKFKMEESLRLNDVLSELGLKEIFDSNKANFKGMVDTSILTDNIYVSEIIQKAFIEVNEGGTVAAAATRAAMVLGSAPGAPKTAIFKVDHPAIFLLMATAGNDKTPYILFLGRLSQLQN